VPVAHTCNPSYSESRNQEDCGMKPAQENSFSRPYFKKPFTKTELVEWLKVNTLSSSPSTTKKVYKEEGKNVFHICISDFSLCSFCNNDIFIFKEIKVIQ
jgi:hypothetical protein